MSVHWRRGRQVTVYYTDKNTGKLRAVPRALTKHLDGKPKDEAIRWEQRWLKEHGMARERTRRTTPPPTLEALWKGYQAQRDSEGSRRPLTVANESADFYNHIVPYFVGVCQLHEPTSWHDAIPDFHVYLMKKSLSPSTRRTILWTLERFGAYLVFSRLMTFPYAVKVPRAKNTKTTPLKVRLEPHTILQWASTTQSFHGINIPLAILLGYFAALRPSELWALSKKDLLTGAYAEKYSATLPGLRSVGLGSKLSVSVTHTIDNKGVEALTKSDKSRGVVNVWSKEAALSIAAILKDMPEGRLFPFSRGWLDKAWKRCSPTVTPHDLRRASALYLGRTLRIPVTLLQEHMRHEEIDTTMLYTREPSVPELVIKSKQNFDDVA